MTKNKSALVTLALLLTGTLAGCDDDYLLNVTSRGNTFVRIVNADTRSVTIKSVIINHDHNSAHLADKEMQRALKREAQIDALPGTIWTGVGVDIINDCDSDGEPITHVEIVTDQGSQGYSFNLAKKQHIETLTTETAGWNWPYADAEIATYVPDNPNVSNTPSHVLMDKLPAGTKYIELPRTDNLSDGWKRIQVLKGHWSDGSSRDWIVYLNQKHTTEPKNDASQDQKLQDGLQKRADEISKKMEQTKQ